MPAERSDEPVIKVELKRMDLGEFVQTDELLANSPLLEHLDPRGKYELLSAGKARRFEPGAIICAQGSTGATLYLVLKGDVGLAHGQGKQSVEVSSVHKGEFFGEAEVLQGPAPRKLAAIAHNEVDLAEFPREAVTRLFDRYPLFQAVLRETHQARSQADDELSDFLNRW